MYKTKEPQGLNSLRLFMLNRYYFFLSAGAGFG